MVLFSPQRKNYGFKWNLKVGHVLAVLLNYGGNENAILRDHFYTVNLADHRKAVKETGQPVTVEAYGVEKKLPYFFLKRRKQHDSRSVRALAAVQPDEQFKFCVSRFIILLSEFSAGLIAHLDMVVKNDFSDQVVFLFLVLLLGTDRRFTTNFRVIESISSLLHYNFESVPSSLWYLGPVHKDRDQRMAHPNKNFFRTLAKMVHEFFPGEYSAEVMTWKIQRVVMDETADHPLNMVHKLELIPASFRGNQLKKQLAFLYLQTRLHLRSIIEPEYASILDVVNTPQLRHCVRETYLRLITHKSNLDYGAVHTIVKLLDIIVGFEPELDFTKEKVEAIKIMQHDFLEVLRKKLPSIGMSTAGTKILLQIFLNIQLFWWGKHDLSPLTVLGCDFPSRAPQQQITENGRFLP